MAFTRSSAIKVVKEETLVAVVVAAGAVAVRERVVVVEDEATAVDLAEEVPVGTRSRESLQVNRWGASLHDARSCIALGQLYTT